MFIPPRSNPGPHRFTTEKSFFKQTPPPLSNQFPRPRTIIQRVLPQPQDVTAIRFDYRSSKVPGFPTMKNYVTSTLCMTHEPGNGNVNVTQLTLHGSGAFFKVYKNAKQVVPTHVLKIAHISEEEGNRINKLVAKWFATTPMYLTPATYVVTPENLFTTVDDTTNPPTVYPLPHKLSLQFAMEVIPLDQHYYLEYSPLHMLAMAVHLALSLLQRRILVSDLRPANLGVYSNILYILDNECLENLAETNKPRVTSALNKTLKTLVESMILSANTPFHPHLRAIRAWIPNQFSVYGDYNFRDWTEQKLYNIFITLIPPQSMAKPIQYTPDPPRNPDVGEKILPGHGTIGQLK